MGRIPVFSLLCREPQLEVNKFLDLFWLMWGKTHPLPIPVGMYLVKNYIFDIVHISSLKKLGDFS